MAHTARGLDGAAGHIELFRLPPFHLKEGEMTTQVDLDERSSAALDAIARETGKTPDQLIHEAVEDLIRRHQPFDRRDLLRQARGMWKDRGDLPDFDLIRSELDRS